MKQCPDCRLVYPNESTFCFIDGASLASLRDARLGSTIAGRYVIERELGMGGMATVYAARHVHIERPCAIKILSPQCAQDPVLRERFAREAKHAQRIAHPNVIQIYDQGETEDGCPFLVMELLEGRCLADVIVEGPLPLSRGLPIAIEMSRALARAHDFEVYHRDLKPENVFLLQGDNVKLLDFGIARSAGDARITNQGEIFGTPQYMAPERGSQLDTGGPGDLYAFGVMLFEMLAGRLPFQGRDPSSFMIMHLREPPPRLSSLVPQASPALDELLLDLMAKSPADRPADAHRVEAALVEIAIELDVAVPAEVIEETPPPSTSHKADDPWRRRLQLFERMVSRAYPGGAPPEPARALEQVRAHLDEIERLRETAFEEQQRLEAIEQEVREGRQRLGRAMNALTADASRTREEARQLRTRMTSLAAAASAFIPDVMAVHKEVVRWEGRCGFAEPYRELSAAYRAMAGLVDAWHEARRIELAAQAELGELERGIADVSFQIRSLRESLSNLERAGEERRLASQQRLAEVGGRAQHLEGEIIQLAGGFCAPLRARPELASLFVDLERVTS